MSEDFAQRLSGAAAVYRHQGDIASALKLETMLSQIDWERPIRVVDLEAAQDLVCAVLDRRTCDHQ